MTSTLSMANLGTADLATARGQNAARNTAAELQNAARAKDTSAVRETAEKFEAQFLLSVVRLIGSSVRLG